MGGNVMASKRASARNRLSDIADALEACEREKIVGRELPQTAVPLLDEAERLGAFSGATYAAVRLALSRWRNRGNEPWSEVIGHYEQNDPSVITYQRIVSTLFPELADAEETESEILIRSAGAGESPDPGAFEKTRIRHEVGKHELEIWHNWAVAAPRIAVILRRETEKMLAKPHESQASSRRSDDERTLLTFLEELCNYQKTWEGAREREFFPLDPGHPLYDSVQRLGTLPSPEPLRTWLKLRNRNRPCKTVKGWENRQSDILTNDIPALRTWAESQLQKCRETSREQWNSPSSGTREKRFRVALSFAGERRTYVAEVARRLAEVFGRDHILYDKYHEAEFARLNLDTYLQRLYRDDSDLIAVFLCKDYEHKDWCGLEWRVVRDLIKARREESVMPLRFDDTEIPGVFSIDGYVSINDRPPEEMAALILKRLESVGGLCQAMGSENQSSGSAGRTTARGSSADERQKSATIQPIPDEYEDGTNVRRGTRFVTREPRTKDWYLPSESMAPAGWVQRWESLRARLERIVDECLPVECVLIQKREPSFPNADSLIRDLSRGSRFVRGGGGLRRECSQLFTENGLPLFGGFFIRDVTGKPFVNTVGEAFGCRYGLFRQFFVYESQVEPGEARRGPGRRLWELARDGVGLLYQLPADLAVSLWCNWLDGFSRGEHSSEYQWLDALFELSWQRKPGDVLYAERYACAGNMSIRLEGQGLFPRLPSISILPESVSIPSDNGHPVVWRSTLPDVARASLLAIDELLQRARGPQSLGPRDGIDESLVLADLKCLPAAQFEELVFHFDRGGVIPGRHAAQADRAVELLRLLRLQEDGLARLRAMLKGFDG
jgi:hypothetical protein